MADEEDEEEAGPTVELGDGGPVEGAPIARVASRLTWPTPKSSVDSREGDSIVRTPEGPRELSGVLGEMEESYFDSRSAFVEAVRDVVGTGPVRTAE